MKLRTILPALLILSLGSGVFAEQVRLRTGDLLQGEILSDQADENGFAFRLFRTGGVFQIRWDQLIEDDEKRLRDLLGLSPWEESEVPLIPGHRVTLVSGAVEVGLAENPDETDQPLRLKTSGGTRPYPRSMIAAVQQRMVEALEVYTPDEMHDMYVEEIAPETPGDYFELAKLCVQVDAHRQAKEYLDISLADPEFMATEKAQLAKSLLAKVEVLIRAEDAIEKKREIRRLAFHKKYDEALRRIEDLRNDYAESPAILKILMLDRLRRETVSSRRKYFRSQVRRRFFKVLDQLVKEKIREKDENDEAVGIQTIKQWASNPRGLAGEIFAKIAEQTGLDEQEAMEFWESRARGNPKHFNYGQGTFIHPEVRDRSLRALTQQGSSRRSSSGSSGRGGRTGASRRGSRGGPKLRSEQDWWASLRSSKPKMDFVKAWFAEMGGGVLEVLRIENRNCRQCAGKGVLISRSVNSAEEVRELCPTCNFAGHERIVICR
jgi:hypothetical protein